MVYLLLSKNMERLTSENHEQFLRTNLGLFLVKPDAIKLGIAEEIINYAIEQVHDNQKGEINGIYIVQLGKDDVPKVYSTVKREIGEVLIDYLTEDVSVLVTFKGNKKDDLWEFLRNMRGKRLMDRTEEELDNSGGIQTGIRDILPVPSTRQLYRNAFEKLKLRRKDSTIPFTDEEYRVYCRNLVHAPDDLREGCALLKLINQEELEQNLTISEYQAMCDSLL